MTKYPIKLIPQIRTALWGREIWLVSGIADMPSVVENGAYAGRNLADLTAEFGPDLAGEKVAAGGRFPMLVKIIEAQDRLSLQVHPSEKTVSLCGGDPKTEMWYVLNGEPGAVIFAGLKQGVGKDRLLDAIRGGTVEDVVMKFDAVHGGVMFIPGGLVHAIGGGCRLYEVQQTSDTTWRLHDWNRIDRKTGLPRKLHEREGIAATDLSLPVPEMLFPAPGEGLRRAVKCRQFEFCTLDLRAPFGLPVRDDTFQVVFAERGACSVETEGGRPVALGPGECALLPPGTAAVLVPSPEAGMLVSIG